MAHDVDRFERRIRAHDERLQNLGRLNELLIPVIRRPGFTTPAEWSFLEFAMETLEQQVELIGKIHAGLVAAAQRVE